MSLRNLRLAAGRDIGEVAEFVAQRTGRPCPAGTAYQWEIRGIEKADILLALSEMYAIPVDEMIVAARRESQTPFLPERRGPKPKRLLQEV